MKLFYKTKHYNYYVTTNGTVYRLNKKTLKIREMKCSQADGQYKLIVLERGKKCFYIHRLVYEAFVGEIPQGMVVDHIDNDSSNNSFTNLQVLTKGDNTRKYFVEVYWRDKNDLDSVREDN